MNICKSEFGTQIFCSHPSSENKDVNQLLLDNKNFECGYLAESFVRPPVFILVSWSSCYKVNKITFKPSFGRHMVDRMSVRCISKYAFKDTVNSDNFQSTIDKLKLTKPDLLIHLASGKQELVEINFLSEYRKSNSNLYIFNLIRNNVVFVLFEILAMKNTSLPCLSSLRIYSAVKRKVINTVKSIDTCLPDLSTPDNKNEDDPLLDNELYPDDCIDPLTAEVLNNPIKLPCGKYVNLETLEKYWNSKPESTPKCNPFTMVPLTDIQIQSSKTIDVDKKKEVAIKIQEFRKRKQDIYDMILNPKKKYVEDARQTFDSDSDEEQLSHKLNENINKNFSFLLNKRL